MKELSSTGENHGSSTDAAVRGAVPDNGVSSKVPKPATVQPAAASTGTANGRQTTTHPPAGFMQSPGKPKSTVQTFLEKIGKVAGAIGLFMFNALSVFMYMLGLFGFLCGAAVPIITVWFFLNVDVIIRWWHVVLGIGGNIGIFIVSMNMIRDLYVQPLIEKIEAAQARAQWGEPPSRH